MTLRSLSSTTPSVDDDDMMCNELLFTFSPHPLLNESKTVRKEKTWVPCTLRYYLLTI
jgi:hypothetical protein